MLINSISLLGSQFSPLKYFFCKNIIDEFRVYTRSFECENLFWIFILVYYSIIRIFQIVWLQNGWSRMFTTAQNGFIRCKNKYLNVFPIFISVIFFHKLFWFAANAASQTNIRLDTAFIIHTSTLVIWWMIRRRCVYIVSAALPLSSAKE